MSTEPNPIPATADQKLDVLRGLIENGYGPAHITAAALVAIDPHVHGRSLISIDEWDCDGDEPSNLHDAALDLIEAGYLTEEPGGLGIQPYSDETDSDEPGVEQSPVGRARDAVAALPTTDVLVAAAEDAASDHSDTERSGVDGAGVTSGNGVGDDHQLGGDRNRI